MKLTAIFLEDTREVGRATLADDGTVVFEGLPPEFVEHLTTKGIIGPGPRRLRPEHGAEFIRGLKWEFKAAPYFYVSLEGDDK
jgi:hypothetical protein